MFKAGQRSQLVLKKRSRRGHRQLSTVYEQARKILLSNGRLVGWSPNRSDWHYTIDSRRALVYEWHCLRTLSAESRELHFSS